MLSWLLRVKSSVLSLAKPSFSSPSPSSSCAWKLATHHIPFPHFHYVHVHRKAFHTAYKTFYIDAHTNMIYITILHASYKTFLNHYLCEQNDARHSQLTLSLVSLSSCMRAENTTPFALQDVPPSLHMRTERRKAPIAN